MNVRWLMLAVTLLCVACGQPAATKDDAKAKTGAAPRPGNPPVLLAGLVPVPTGGSSEVGQDPKTQEPAGKVPQEESQEPTTPEEKLAAWQKAYAEAAQAYSAALRAAKTPEDRQAAQELAPNMGEYVEKFMTLAQENPKTPVALQAYTWIVRNGRGSPASREAIQAVMTDFAESEEIGDMLPLVAAGMPSAENEATLQKFINHSPHDSVKAKATVALARMLRQVIDLNERMASDEAIKEQLSRSLGEKGLEFFASAGTDTSRLEDLYQSVLDHYSDLRLGNRTAGQMAEGALFEIRNLAIGKIVPDIEGHDLDEVAFKLSEYRGKIVVLDFWGDW